MSKKIYPPLIQNFIDVQLQYPDYIVATEVGGFFEIWGVNHPELGYIGHAKKASLLLDTILTKRNKSDPESPDMSGFPSHSAEGYFKKLVNLGQTVVVVEQSIRGSKSENNKNVSREVTKILSPGTSLDRLIDSSNNFFASIYTEDNLTIGLTLLDVSTGDVKLTELLHEQLDDFIKKYNPKEMLITGKIKIDHFDHQLVHYNSSDKVINKLSATSVLLENLYELENNITKSSTYAIENLNLSKWKNATLSFGNLINFLSATKYNSLLLKKLSKPDTLILSNELYVSKSAHDSLDIFNDSNDKPSLYKILNNCKTSMGRRLLRNWILAPLTDKNEIINRHNQIETYIQKNNFNNKLEDVYDIQRLARKLIFGKLMPHEINQLYYSLEIIKSVFEQECLIYEVNTIKNINELIDSNIDLLKSERATDSSNFDFLKGKSLEEISVHYKKWELANFSLISYKDTLSNKLNYDKLKIIEKSEGFELVCPKGALEILKNNKISFKEKASEIVINDSNWDRLSFETFGLKQKFLLLAKSQFEKFQIDLHNVFGNQIIDISNKIAKIDVLMNFAKISLERNYIKPLIIDKNESILNIKNMRHPIVELNEKLNQSFIPNDIDLNNSIKTLVIYGANSAGKSTILKSCALIILMNQIGCFIPASNGSELSIFEAILTRISSNDDLNEGMSTFVLEMTELNNALQYLNKKSLFLFDEIGRGTSVEDGEALAFATLSFLNSNDNQSLTLFATHYHSLYENINDIDGIDIQHVHTELNEKNEIVFKRKLEKGPGQGSYGIIVAKSCNLPLPLIRIAENYSKKFEPVLKSRYHKEKFGILCEICKVNPAQETHHVVEQKQGKVKSFIDDNNITKSINHISNLQMLCSTCHDKITKERKKGEKE